MSLKEKEYLTKKSIDKISTAIGHPKKKRLL